MEGAGGEAQDAFLFFKNRDADILEEVELSEGGAILGYGSPGCCREEVGVSAEGPDLCCE